MNKIRRIKKSRKRLDKAEKNLITQRFRRKQAENGNIWKALFGKPLTYG